MRLAVFISFVAILVSSLVASPSVHAQSDPNAPRFVLGFKTLADLIPDIVGQPIENEHFSENGDSLQQTTTGLMVWRKADNLTAFTNGSHTWINGPFGLQGRNNDDRFPWESPERPSPSPPPPPPAPAPPPAPPASTGGAMAAPPGYSTLVFEDQFAGTNLDSSRWIPEIADQSGIWRNNGRLPPPLSAVGNAGKYNAEYGSPSEIQVNNGLTLNAQVDGSQPGYSWKAGYVSTHGKFYFSGGFIQIKARMPDSRTGGWGGLWFLEGGGEIDLQESGYTALGADKANQVIASSVHTSGNRQQFYDTGVDLSADYHVYGMEYKPGESITIYFDGRQIARYTSNIPTGAYSIILTNTLAQNTAGWHTAIGPFTPSSLQMSIAEVQVWK